MNRYPTLRGFILAIVLAPALSFGTHAQQVYRCQQPDGSTAFQQRPCDAGQPGRAVQVRPNVVEASGQREQAAVALQNRRRVLDSNGQVYAGMSTDELRQRLGQAQAVNSNATAEGVDQQHVYRFPDGSVRYVYTRDGRVVEVAERAHSPLRRHDLPAARRPDLVPCYTDTQVRNALVSARALDLSEAERARAMHNVEDMRACRR